jgi:hypothetical protein
MLTLLRNILSKTGDPLRQSIYNALYYLNDLEDKKTGVGYLETMMRYIFSVAQLILTNIFSIKIWMKLDDISISLGAGSWDMGMMKYLSRTNGLNLIEHSTLKNMPPKVGHKTPTVGGISFIAFFIIYA